MLKRWMVWPALLGLAVLAAAAPAAAAGPGASAGESSKQVVSTPVGGVQVAVDARTGRLRQPTPQEARALASELARLFQPRSSVAPTHYADGTVGMVVDSEYFNFSVVRIGANGRLESTCIDGRAAADNFLAGGAAALEVK
jgi:hypothetical protein